MSEERPEDFVAEPGEAGTFRIANLGRDPWLIKELQGEVKFKRSDSSALKVVALDANGYPVGAPAEGGSVGLRPGGLYYLVTGR